MPKLAIYPSTICLSSIGKHGFQHVLYGKISKKQTFLHAAILDHFQTKMLNLRPLLSITFPKGFQNSKSFGHPTSGSGGKKTFKRYLKSEQTDTRTDGHFDL